MWRKFVRFWHKADMLVELDARFVRGTDICSYPAGDEKFASEAAYSSIGSMSIKICPIQRTDICMMLKIRFERI